MKIYDCFMFFNELDVLEIRFNELYNVIDKFVLIESLKSHSGNNKPLYFKDNEKRFSKFLDKIIHIVVDDFPCSSGMERDNFQRNFITKGIEDANANDIILISDCDEIPKASIIANISTYSLPCHFEQQHSTIYLNRITKNEKDRVWRGTAAILKKDIQSPQGVRNSQNSYKPIINGGWHLSYCGGINAVCEKVINFAHTEYSHIANNREALSKRIENHSDLLGRNGGETITVKIDESFPEYVYKNIDKFQHLIEK
jgi:beta-1,4-mannosyl-glycoprotein beta-1,4-N-acetylglucosaminyltransferase